MSTLREAEDSFLLETKADPCFLASFVVGLLEHGTDSISPTRTLNCEQQWENCSYDGGWEWQVTSTGLIWFVDLGSPLCSRPFSSHHSNTTQCRSVNSFSG